MDVEKFDMTNYLSVLPMFSNLTKPERENISQDCALRRLSRGEMVFRAGEQCEEFHVIVTGQVKLYVASSSGQEKIVELIGPGQSFAEAMMFLNKPHMLNAQTLTDTMLMSVSKQAVFGEIERDPRFSMHMLAGISRRLHGLLRDVEGYALHSGMQRLIGYLLRDLDDEITDDMGTITVSLPVSKATIASRLSLTPEYFSRVLHELEAERLIEIDKREIRILDVRRLASYGCH
ncbi:MAG: Crp/Fnr family transcriptional regulator [Rhodoferax sp.]|uniref:Crp/Fnr family transcriptional regulator n=1 Tax=Rhodoferax sp. TaxID=50421 RepID=UPI00301ADCB2